jgi:hypothetical protein
MRALGALALVSLDAENGPIWRYGAILGPVPMPMSDHRSSEFRCPWPGGWVAREDRALTAQIVSGCSACLIAH